MLNEPLAAELGLDPRLAAEPDGVRPAGRHRRARPVPRRWRRPTPATSSAATSPRLGDGRALLLGELADADGRLRDLHLKGSGRTPFARGGDGLAAVGPDAARVRRQRGDARPRHPDDPRPSPSWRPGRPVHRETLLPGAVLARVASSHLRVGSFQYARATGDADLLRRLADHAIARHHPAAADAEHPYLALFEAVVAAQASLVARWMLVGFVHGVMNTDNMTISGETIDYGPCAFLDAFDPATVYSSIDTGGRYAYGNQPLVAEWNLARLAEALLPLLARRPGAGDRPRGGGARRRSGRSTTPPGRPACAAKLGLPDGLDDAVRPPLVDEVLALLRAEPRRLHVVLPRPGRGGPRRRRAGAQRWSWTSPAFDALAGALARRWPRTPRRWTGSTRSTSRATTWSRRRSPPRPPATWRRCTGCSTR